ncbi:MAG: class I SAM-dependent methyltransferase [Pseudomonadota bacterium]
MTDDETLRVYAARADEYDSLTEGDQIAAHRAAFLAALPPGDEPVLDWGAGPGQDAAAMIAAGTTCEATDASPEMVALAQARDVPTRCEPFEALAPGARYRGVWANFSLLHADPDALPDLIHRAAGTLLPGGILHVAMKRGAGTARDGLGRRYTYLEADDLDRLTAAAGLECLSVRHGQTVGLDGQPAGYVIHLSRAPDA